MSRKDRCLTLQAYKARGDQMAGLTPLENAVRKRADEVRVDARPTEDELTGLREAFVPAMVRVNDKGEYVRRPARMDTLPARSHPLLERLAKARLLIIRQEGELRLVEVAHEALLRKWPWLKEKLDAERVFLIGKQQLEQDLRDWQAAADQDKADALLTGLKLTRARVWLVEHPTRLTSEERAFIQASIEREEAERRSRERKQRNTTRAWIAAAMVLAVLFVWALWLWSKAQESERQARAALREARAALSGQIAARAQALLDQNPRLSSLLAVEALNITQRAHDPPTVAAREALLRVLANSGGRVVGQLEDPISTVVLSPNGRWLATVGHNVRNESTARLWDLAAQNPLAKPHDIPDVADPVAISSNSHWLVTGGPDRGIRIWDLTSPNPADRSMSLPGPIENIGISGNSRWLVTARSDDHVAGSDGDGVAAAQLWDLESPDATRHPIPLVGHRRAVTAIAFSPDGRWLATGSGGCHSHTGDRDDVIRLWDLKASNFQETPVLLAGHGDPIDALAFSPDSHRLASGSGDSSASASGHVLRDRWSSRTCGGDHVATIWDLTTTPAPEGSLLASGIPIAVSVDSRRLVTLENDAVRLWDLAAKSNRAEPVTLSEGGVPLHVSVIAVSPDHRWLATGSGNKAQL
jgi:WD40 repeat protein